VFGCPDPSLELHSNTFTGRLASDVAADPADCQLTVPPFVAVSRRSRVHRHGAGYRRDLGLVGRSGGAAEERYGEEARPAASMKLDDRRGRENRVHYFFFCGAGAPGKTMGAVAGSMVPILSLYDGSCLPQPIAAQATVIATSVTASLARQGAWPVHKNKQIGWLTRIGKRPPEWSFVDSLGVVCAADEIPDVNPRG